MGPSLLVTGATGYVGRRVVARARGLGFSRVVAMVRRAGTAPEGVEERVGDLSLPGGWQDALAGVDRVIHLGALTGKARARDHHRVNAMGARALAAACAAAGVSGLVHVSSVAVKFRERAHYHYADAKAAAEVYVRACGVPFTIVRPTMVFGPGAPVLTGLAKIACAPVMPVFGAGDVLVQPVHVDDLAGFLLAVAAGPFEGRTLEVGGADRIPLEDLLVRIRRARTGRGPRTLHLPLAAIRALLGLVEPVLLPVLPLTAGQLATFANEGTADTAQATAAVGQAWRGVDEMLSEEAGDD